MNFNKKDFSKILIKIKDSYGSINKMSEKIGITSSYISKLIRLMYDSAPSPEVLKKIADNSNGIISYIELMNVCGYFNNLHKEIKQISKLQTEFIVSKEEYLKKNEFTQSEIIELQNIATINSDTDKFEKELATYTLNLDKSKQFIVLGILKELNSFIRNRFLPYDIILTNSNKEDKLFLIPILCKITAGQPILTDENVEGYLPTDPNIYHLTDPDNYFYLKVNDNSMNKIIAKNTYVLFKMQETANTEDIVLVCIDNKEPIIRKCMKIENNMAIFQTLSDEKSELEVILNNERSYKILGKMIAQINIV